MIVLLDYNKIKNVCYVDYMIWKNYMIANYIDKIYKIWLIIIKLKLIIFD
jgi:hypothetical protein